MNNIIKVVIICTIICTVGNNYVFANVAFIKEDITNELKSSEETKTQQKSFNDIINLNKIIYFLVKNDKIKELYEIIKDYDTNVKTVETIIKIDKTMPKITLSQKNKKIFNMYVKNKLN